MAIRTDRSTTLLSNRMRVFLFSASLTLFALIIISTYLSPFGYMTVTAIKDRSMIADPNAPILPSKEATFNYEGQELAVYLVPTEDGKVHEWAILKKGREESTFIDPTNLEAGPTEWTGRWRTLERVWSVSPVWENFSEAWKGLNMPRLLRNTLVIAITGSIGTLISCIAVAYGFSRFRIPGKNILFMALISTIILPEFVTIVPTYVVFERIGWIGTWLPLIIPHFFANAYNVFLLRQFFMTIPKELDEAAMIDGASPMRILFSVILPQSIPAIVAVGMFHFMWSWNDFFQPLLYLSTERELQPISIGIQLYNARYFAQPHMIQASSLLGLLVPIIIFFLAQRIFMQGIVFTGVEK
ncbi:MAG: carbohydrate ABC transporter permease [Chloroflexi bacterium]|nr:carbohydrate ABC transporter permease [Chloroflexota bacterium]